MSLDYSHGGLRAPNIELMSKSLKLAWIARLLKKEQPWEEAWKTIPNYFLNKYGGLNFLLKCNYNGKFLRQIHLPHFYKSMLQHFLELKVAYNCDIGQDLVLFNNKEILIENQTIFYKEWFQKGIFLVQDLLHENGQLLTFQEFIQRYDVKCNFLKYMQVVSAIPKHLLDKAREKQVGKRSFSCRNGIPTLSEHHHRFAQNEKQRLLLASHKQRRCKNKGYPKMGTRPSSGRP